jgi:hypothetical protein
VDLSVPKSRRTCSKRIWRNEMRHIGSSGITVVTLLLLGCVFWTEYGAPVSHEQHVQGAGRCRRRLSRTLSPAERCRRWQIVLKEVLL